MSRSTPSTAGFWAVETKPPVAGPVDSGKGQGPKKGSFPRIKQGLDPNSSYIIFEHYLGKEGESIFDPAFGVYGFFSAQGLTWQQVADPDLSAEYLVIRVVPGREDQVLGRMLGYGFPENMVFYIFKAEEV